MINPIWEILKSANVLEQNGIRSVGPNPIQILDPSTIFIGWFCFYFLFPFWSPAPVNSRERERERHTTQKLIKVCLSLHGHFFLLDCKNSIAELRWVREKSKSNTFTPSSKSLRHCRRRYFSLPLNIIDFRTESDDTVKWINWLKYPIFSNRYP